MGHYTRIFFLPSVFLNILPLDKIPIRHVALAHYSPVTFYTVFQKKTGPFVISSHVYFDSYELHENFQKYIGVVACCEYGINLCDLLTILCSNRYNETTVNIIL